MKKVAVLLIVAGILTALYPVANRIYFFHRQARILEHWEESMDMAPPSTFFGEGDIRGQEEGPEEGFASVQGKEPVAVLVIGKINLEIPVFMGATGENLRLGAGLLETSAFMGEKGNSVITSHRSHSFGMQFNRLDEVEPGDELYVKTRAGEYRYVVFAKQIVEPAEISLLELQGEARLLTLVTCHPLYSRDPPCRLVVQARMH